MSKVSKQEPKPVKMTIQDAVMNMAQRVKKLEELGSIQTKALEKKIGDLDNKLIDGAPDLDQVAEMFKVHSDKIDSLLERISELEKKNDIKPKKKGNVKLNELEEPGISFS